MSADAAANKHEKSSDRDGNGGTVGFYARRNSRDDIVAKAVTQLKVDLKKLAESKGVKSK